MSTHAVRTEQLVLHGDDWKQRLFQGYVSTGQALSPAMAHRQVRANDYPYFSWIIKCWVPESRDIRIADLACGHGALVQCLKHFGYRDVQGVDISREQISMARELGIDGVERGDIAEFLKEHPATFDVLFLMDILEHIAKQNLLDLLDLVHRSLRKNGIAIIHVPNGEGIFSMGIRYGDLTHELCFTPDSMRQALTACGFKTIRCVEDKPVIHGFRSLARSVLWNTLTALPRVMLLAETGAGGHILSRNMLVIAS